MQPPLILRIFTHLVLGFCSLVVLLPLLWVLRTSFVDKVIAYQLPPPLFFTPTLENYRIILAEMNFGAFFLNSLIIALTSTLLAVVIGALAAYAIDRYRAGGRAMPVVILATQMMPPIVLVIPFFLIFKDIGLADTHLGLILAHSTFAIPFSTWMMISYFNAIPRSLDEAAQVDGCRPFGAMIRVVLPVTLPGIIATGIYIFITSWNEFLYASVLAGQDVRVLTVAIQTLIGEYEIAWGLLTSGGVIGALPVTLLFMLIQKRLIAGMTQGAVKG